MVKVAKKEFVEKFSDKILLPEDVIIEKRYKNN